MDIDLQDVVYFLWGCLVEIDGHIVRAANVVYSKGLSEPDLDWRVKEWTNQGHRPPGAGVVDSGLRMHEPDHV